ncbi:transglycosylase SLT domain-containing protein [Paenibacillus sp. CC-CFT747]|nr:transglycosylase SLT domain-containing protein [Paenibacillus sp. CC-CFT747]
MWDRSRESGLSFSLLLAMAKQESNLGQDKVNVNTNGTVDKGIMQVNSSSLDWLAGLARIQEVDPMNDYHSVDLAIAFLKFARNYWEKQGLTGERLENYMIVSYNRGIGGCRYYDQTYGINNNAYLIKVRQNQERFDLQL